MNIDLSITTADNYFNEVEKVIDWDGDSDDKSQITYEQADDILKILSTEVSLFLFRRNAGVDGMMIDTMSDLRQSLIMEYEKTWCDKYICYNDFY